MSLYVMDVLIGPSRLSPVVKMKANEVDEVKQGALAEVHL